jgi:hypothetical protein
VKIRFSIKMPSAISKDGNRSTFAIVRDVRFADGRREQTTVEDESLTALNENYLTGLIGRADAEIQVRSVIKPRLEKQAGIQDKKDLEETVSEQNLAVFKKYWTHITRERKLKHPSSSRNDLLAALNAIEPVALMTATKDELLDALNSLSDKKYRRRAIRINQLLKFLGREIKLSLRAIEPETVHCVKWEELQKILPLLPSDESRLLAKDRMIDNLNSLVKNG